MDEETAVKLLDVPRETLTRIEAFVRLLSEESKRQNLVSRDSLAQVWSRHILDSKQLIRFAHPGAGRWLDLGSGAGFPGLLVPLFHAAHVTLIESRKLRVEFLSQAAEVLGTAGNTTVIHSRVEKVPSAKFDVISARAFAPLPKLLDLAERFSTPDTVWILPKGRNAKSELEAAESLWQGAFRLEPSVTDADASIIVADQVRRKVRGTVGR